MDEALLNYKRSLIKYFTCSELFQLNLISQNINRAKFKQLFMTLVTQKKEMGEDNNLVLEELY
jgi:hypothetical protein